MKRSLILICVLALVIVVVLFKIFSDSSRHAAEKAAVAAVMIEAEGFVARDTSVVSSLTTVGTLRANESCEIVSEVARKVTGIPLREGSVVKKGQLLIKLDDADLVASLGKLEHQRELCEANEARERALLAKGGVSRRRYDETLNTLNVLKSEILVLRSALDKTELRAPFAGRIGLRNVSVGAVVNPSIVLAALQDVSRIKVDFSVPERHAADIRPGQLVHFTMENDPREFEARVSACEPGVDEKTRTILVRAVASNADNQLVPGMSVKVTLDLAVLNRTLFVPTEALMPSVKGYSVFTMRNGRARSSVVRTGMRTGSAVQILEGAAAGDTLIMTNLLRIRPDDPVRIMSVR